MAVCSRGSIHHGDAAKRAPAPLAWCRQGHISWLLTPTYSPLSQALAELRQLRHLGLSECPDVHLAALPALVRELPCLTRLCLGAAALGGERLAAVARVRSAITRAQHWPACADCPCADFPVLSSFNLEWRRCTRTDVESASWDTVVCEASCHCTVACWVIPRLSLQHSHTERRPSKIMIMCYMQGAPRLRHLEARCCGLSASALQHLPRLRALSTGALPLLHSWTNPVKLSRLRGLTQLQVHLMSCDTTLYPHTELLGDELAG